MIANPHSTTSLEKITRPVREKVTIWVAGDCRPINIVEDSGMIEEKLLLGKFLRFTVEGHHCVKKNTIKQQCLKYTLSEVITCLFIRFSLKKKNNFLSRLINFKMCNELVNFF